jgi:hypothetical protein
MNPYQEFVKLVEEMRQAQKGYFKTRERADLFNSKALEKEVDRWLITIGGNDGK